MPQRYRPRPATSPGTRKPALDARGGRAAAARLIGERRFCRGSTRNDRIVDAPLRFAVSGCIYRLSRTLEALHFAKTDRTKTSARELSTDVPVAAQDGPTNVHFDWFRERNDHRLHSSSLDGVGLAPRVEGGG